MKNQKKLYKVFLFILFMSSACYAYVVDNKGKQMQVKNKNLVNMIDDIEIQEGEALSSKQILNIIESSGSSVR